MTNTARATALAILQKFFANPKILEEVLNKTQSYKTLQSQDKAFCRMMVSSVLRHNFAIQKMLQKLLQHKYKKTDRDILTILKIGCVQILYMDVPEHAALNETVELCTIIKQPQAKGFVNAILRRILREKIELFSSLKPKDNVPEWLWQSWRKDYGDDVATQIITANLQQAPLDLQFVSEAAKEQFLQAHEGDVISLHALHVRLKEASSVVNLPYYQDGIWWVQDLASSQPVHSLGSDLSGKTVLDLCAAPGGKTAQLCAAGANVTAIDISEKRLEKLKQNMQRLGFKPEIISADVFDYKPSAPFDVILLDAPCSATGTIRRHPDLLHIRQPEDLDTLIELQKNILKLAADWVKPGGMMIYAVCSLQKSEGEAQIATFLDNHSDYTLEGDMHRNLPFEHAEHGGMDGFFFARLKKAT